MNTQNSPAYESGPKRFLKSVGSVLRKLDRGQLWTDLESGMADVVDGLKLHGGVGKITIEINAKMKNGQLMLDSKFSKVVPQAARVPTIMFEGDDGELTDMDPRQPRLNVVKVADRINGVEADDLDQ